MSVGENNLNLEILNNTKGKLPSLPFVKIKETVLGKKYELSIVFCGNRLSRKLNNLYRKKDKPTNVLSFSLSKNSGEIFLNLPTIRKQSTEFNSNFKQHTLRLLIHGLLHLKGFEHSAKMDRLEAKFLKKFSF